ncbi:MAG: hypothetical protein K6T90_20825 [Leptolyngbyaceae cyanobacterium HOT.MB2.61]|nr:hypothetical protein [Leptolyngbyaceae cyanobacterium HOT.MB2.61]
MRSYWKTTITKATIWLAAEILLTVVGLDNLADYSEFIFEREVAGGAAIATAVQISNP